jgi:hypothetical protein
MNEYLNDKTRLLLVSFENFGNGWCWYVICMISLLPACLPQYMYM